MLSIRIPYPYMLIKSSFQYGHRLATIVQAVRACVMHVQRLVNIHTLTFTFDDDDDDDVARKKRAFVFVSI